MTPCMTYLHGLVNAVGRHMDAAPGCGCSVCTWVRLNDEPSIGPFSETNMANTDAWQLSDQNQTEPIPAEAK